MKKYFFILLLAVFPTNLAFAGTFEVSGWIPYWRTGLGALDVLPHLDLVTEVNPFGYTVKNNGSINDAAYILQAPWVGFIAAARAKGVRVIPSVMWSDAANIHKILKNPATRAAHINEIVSRVNAYNFDGIDIDYEAKWAETRPYFSLFLKELYAKMGKKFVMCTIEARTPLVDRYKVVPKTAPEYANDFVALNKYCDRVRFMTYDQGRIDLKLNASSSFPYVPVSDPKWVEKAIKEAAKTISKKKIVLGIPTYGYEWELVPIVEPGYEGKYYYDLLWSFNPKWATNIATYQGLDIKRSDAGELYISYTPTSTPNTGSTTPFRVLTWSDAQAMKDKIDLAKRLGIRGVAIFKWDGGEDQQMWDILKGVKK